MAGYVLGRAGTLAGLNALQTQSYGSESRGGACKSDVIVSKTEILELAPSGLDVFIAMSQPALDKYLPDISDGGSLIYDSDLVTLNTSADDAGNDSTYTFGISATDIAHKSFGHDVVANVIMLGYMSALTGVVSPEALRQAISESVPPKTVELNLKAFDEGFKKGEMREGELK